MLKTFRYLAAIAIAPSMAFAQQPATVPALPGAVPANVQPPNQPPQNMADLRAIQARQESLRQQQEEAQARIADAKAKLEEVQANRAANGQSAPVSNLTGSAAPMATNTPIVLTPRKRKEAKKPTVEEILALEKKLAMMRSDARVSKAYDQATMRADRAEFTRAKVVFPYIEKSIYEIQTAPGKMTVIELQPGEKIVGKGLPMVSDSAQWIISTVDVGEGEDKYTQVLIKPMVSDIENNLLISTNRRSYYIVAHANGSPYMPLVGFNYPHDEARQQEAKAEAIEEEERKFETVGINPEDMNFAYEIKGPKVEWKPIRVFDNGVKTFIQMSPKMRSYEAPALFVMEEEKEPILVNYRVKGDYYIVDRLFNQAQLRVGKKNIVKILRDGDRHAVTTSTPVNGKGVPHA